MMAAKTDNTAFNRNTQAVPATAISVPATNGPTMREMCIVMPLSITAAGNCARGTTSGTMAANTGQRTAMAMPLNKVSVSNKIGVMRSKNIAKHSSADIVATVAELSKRGVEFVSSPRVQTSERGALSKTWLGSVSFEIVHDLRG